MQIAQKNQSFNLCYKLVNWNDNLGLNFPDSLVIIALQSFIVYVFDKIKGDTLFKKFPIVGISIVLHWLWLWNIKYNVINKREVVL